MKDKLPEIAAYIESQIGDSESFRISGDDFAKRFKLGTGWHKNLVVMRDSANFPFAIQRDFQSSTEFGGDGAPSHIKFVRKSQPNPSQS